MRGPSVDEGVEFMVGSGSQTRLEESEYDVIQSAMAETERGRQFLAEFARRCRGDDTQTLLRAIARLESAVTNDASGVPGSDAMRDAVAAMAESISRARADIASMTVPEEHENPPAGGLDTLVQDTERATCAILGAAEATQEAAWSLRERGADAGLCDVLDRRAITIYTACSAQDLSARRTGRAVATLRDLETRIAALLGEEAPSATEHASAASSHALPPLPEAPLAADDIALVPSQAAGDRPSAGPLPDPTAVSADDEDDVALAFADFDRLSIEEKIALFS